MNDSTIYLAEEEDALLRLNDLRVARQLFGKACGIGFYDDACRSLYVDIQNAFDAAMSYEISLLQKALQGRIGAEEEKKGTESETSR